MRQGKNISKEQPCKREENIAPDENIALEENVESDLAFNSLRLANSKRVASNYNEIYTILWRLNLTHLSTAFQKELIDIDILKITTALELRKVLGIPFGLAKQIKMEVERIHNETGISDYFEKCHRNDVPEEENLQ